MVRLLWMRNCDRSTVMVAVEELPNSKVKDLSPELPAEQGR